MRAAGPGSAARTCRTRWLPRRAYCWPTGGGELPTPAIWCGWMARSVGLRGRRRRARRSALRSGIHLRSREYSGRLGCRRCLSGRGGRTRSPSKRLRQTGLRRRQAGLVIPASAATVWSLIVRWVIVVSICFAAKDSEIRRSMGAVPVGAGSSQVATSWASDRCIRCRAAILSADCANLARANSRGGLAVGGSAVS